MSKVLRKTFLDICNGYSLGQYKGVSIYIQHLSHKEHLDLDELESTFFQHAKNEGLPTEKEKIESLKKQGFWSDKKETEIIQQNSYIARLIDGKKNLTLPSVLQKTEELIKEEEKKLAQLQKNKNELIGLTCESYATKLVNEYYIVKSIFIDKNLSIPLFTEEQYQELEDEELDEIVNIYNKSTEPCSEKNIKLLAIQDFYQSYYYLCGDNFSSFFDRPIWKFSYYQVKLANFSRYYKSLFENHDTKNLPEKVRKDPDLLVDYLTATTKAKEQLEKQHGQAVGMVGATASDLQQIAPNAKNASQVFNKPMTMQDMMKAMGQKV